MTLDTIAAISTGMSHSGIGIIRITGADSFSVIDQIYQGKKLLSKEPSHTIHYGHIVNDGEMVDEVLVSILRAPRTFTGEDTVEIHCHGGTFVVTKVLEVVLKTGVRAAMPGEFTKRAFLNGKMDLSQAEAVIDVIQAQNEYALKSSLSQLKGSVKGKIKEIRDKIIYHTAFIETALDDPEHISVDGYGEKLYEEVKELIQSLKRLIDSADNGRVLKEGIQTVIVGKPNVGKSTLLNVLAGKERAIVTEIAGTTRDALEEQIYLDGLSLQVIDTAGIRETDNRIEQLGVDKTKEYVENADLIIYVVDASRPLDEDDQKIWQLVSQKKLIVLLNKSDLITMVSKEMLQEAFSQYHSNEMLQEEFSQKNSDDEFNHQSKSLASKGREGGGLNLLTKTIPMIDVSAKEEEGIEEFNKTLRKMFLKKDFSFNEEVFVSSARQKNALSQAYQSLKKVVDSITNQLPEDFYSIDLMDAYEALGHITGESIGEDLINEIFSRFCVGK